jgi:hypothetical protein
LHSKKNKFKKRKRRKRKKKNMKKTLSIVLSLSLILCSCGRSSEYSNSSEYPLLRQVWIEPSSEIALNLMDDNFNNIGAGKIIVHGENPTITLSEIKAVLPQTQCGVLSNAVMCNDDECIPFPVNASVGIEQLNRYSQLHAVCVQNNTAMVYPSKNPPKLLLDKTVRVRIVYLVCGVIIAILSVAYIFYLVTKSEKSEKKYKKDLVFYKERLHNTIKLCRSKRKNMLVEIDAERQRREDVEIDNYELESIGRETGRRNRFMRGTIIDLREDRTGLRRQVRHLREQNTDLHNRLVDKDGENNRLVLSMTQLQFEVERLTQEVNDLQERLSNANERIFALKERLEQTRCALNAAYIKILNMYIQQGKIRVSDIIDGGEEQNRLCVNSIVDFRPPVVVHYTGQDAGQVLYDFYKFHRKLPLDWAREGKPVPVRKKALAKRKTTVKKDPKKKTSPRGRPAVARDQTSSLQTLTDAVESQNLPQVVKIIREQCQSVTNIPLETKETIYSLLKDRLFQLSIMGEWNRNGADVFRTLVLTVQRIGLYDKLQGEFDGFREGVADECYDISKFPDGWAEVEDVGIDVEKGSAGKRSSDDGAGSKVRFYEEEEEEEVVSDFSGENSGIFGSTNLNNQFDLVVNEEEAEEDEDQVAS